MTTRSEMPRWLILQAEIDYLYFCLGQLHKQMPKNAVERMIDQATGNDRSQVAEAAEIAAQMKKLKAELSEETGEFYPTTMEDAILSLLPEHEPNETRGDE